ITLLSLRCYQSTRLDLPRSPPPTSGERIPVDGPIPAVHLLSAFIPCAAVVLQQLRVDGKTNEHKAALKMRGVLPGLRGKVATFDAMFTHRDVAEEVLDQGGDYLFIVKDNQPLLKAQIRAAINDDGDFSPLPA